MKRQNFVQAFLLVAVVLADQASKYWILTHFQEYEVRPIVEGLFNLTLTFNRGVAFGLFANLADPLRSIVLGLSALLAFAALFYFYLVDFRSDRFGRAALMLICGGAIGNIIDRVRLGMVVDFLDLFWGTAHWPAFNVADSCICIGVALLLLRSGTVAAQQQSAKQAAEAGAKAKEN